jgi:uncharacterized transporter YbjL
MILLAVLAGSLALGWFLGSRRMFKNRITKTARIVMFAALGMILFVMGLSLGSRPEIVSNLHTIGLQALTISLGGAFGAVFTVAAVRRLWRARNGVRTVSGESDR